MNESARAVIAEVRGESVKEATEREREMAREGQRVDKHRQTFSVERKEKKFDMSLCES